MSTSGTKPSPAIEVRDSPLHGLGVFATRRIRKGTRVVEYLGERVSHAEADRRYENKDADDAHTFLFIVDSRTVIDAGVDGNVARFVNHGCAPNCESVIENRRVFIDAIRTIQQGEELTYDYQIPREASDPPDIDEIFACRCGAESCRGSMLWPPRHAKPQRQSRRR
jgi:SET domain-containing protein